MDVVRGKTGLVHFGVSKLAQACALGLLLSFAMSGHAADDRAVKTRVAPIYPELAKRMRISGSVKLEVTVDADGKVTDVKTVNGNRALATAAEDAVRKWKFVPGAGVSNIEIDINFAGAQ